MATLPVLVGSDEDWTPSNYSPDWRVEIAFTSTYITPAADRVWTDVSEWVELHENVDITVGRQDERSIADANQLTLTLDNKDGRFTAKRAASPYYPNVKVGRPIRVSVITQTGHTSVRFVGFIDGWPVEWDGSDAYAKASIKATSRLSRLGLTAKLRSAVEQEILGPTPVAYYTLGDPSGATSASESSGVGVVGPLTESATGSESVTFGNAIGVASDGLTAMTYPIDGRPWTVSLPSATVRSMRICYLAGAGDVGGLMAQAYGPSTLVLGHNGATDSPSHAAFGGRFGFALEAGASTPDVLHDLVVTSSVVDGTRLYHDGAEVATGAGTDYTGIHTLQLGIVNNPISFTFCHLAIYDTILTPAQIALQADAALSGFTGDTTDERLLRILGWAGVPATEVDTDAGVETMTYQETGGQTVVDALRDVESTEGGVLFDGTDGKLIFHNRSRRYLATPAVTLDMAAQHVESDYAPRLDRSTLVNDVTVSNPTTGETARSTSPASSDEYGVATGSATSVADSYDPIAQKAAWLIASYAEPQIRVPSLTVDVLAHVGLTPSAEDLLQVGVGDRIDVVNAPTQADSTDASYFVEGYSESIGPESHRITFNLSPTYPTLNTFVLDSATLGVLDTNILAY